MLPTKQEVSGFYRKINAKIHSKAFFHAISGDSEAYIKCKHCENIINLREAKISGYDSEHSLRHIHCNKCGRIVKWSPGERNIPSLIQGVCGIILGGALAYLLYPHLNVYGLQAGFFTSVYGLFKALIS